MAGKDGTISIAIEVDGKEIKVASKELDNLEASAGGVGKGIKAAESSMDGLADSSAKASKDVKGVTDSVDGLADSGSKASKDLKGADGAIDGIADSSTQAASSVRGVGDSLDQVGDKASKTSDQLGKTSEETEKVGKQAPKASIGLKDLAVSLGLVAVASAAFNTLKSSMDSAIARFDTLNSFPKVLQALGVSAEDSEAAMSKLSDGIDGLPTTLNDIAASAQRMYTSFNDMDVAADTAIALNNAMLGSGSSAEAAQRGVDQYTKALQTGKIQMDTWNTLSETMDVGLIKIAEGFGFAGKSAKDDLYQALQNGTVTLDEFNAKLIEVGTGTGIMAELAKENSLGISTSLGNLKNAAARGIANIIESFDKLAQEVTGKDIAQNIDSLKAVVNTSFKTMGAVVEGTAPVFVAFGSTVKTVLPVVNALTPAIIGLMAAYGTYAVISKVTGIINASNAILAVATASNKALMIATMASATASGADAAAKAAQGGAISIVTLAIGVMTGSIKLSTAAQIIGTTASYAFGAAIRFMMGPIGWVITGIGLLVTGVIALVGWFNKSSEESKRLSEETDELKSSIGNLTDDIERNSSAHKESLRDIEASKNKNAELMKTVDELSSKENKSAAEKQILAGYINELNDSVDGLNLSYNEQTNALSMSSEEMEKQIEMMAERERFTEAMERQVEITKEQFEIDSRLEEITELEKEYRDAVEAKSETAKNAGQAIGELREEEELLRAKSEELAAEHDRLMAIIAEATENGVNISVDALEEWIGKNEELLDRMSDTYNEILDITTNAFSKMSEESKASASEMIANLEHNQEMTRQWGNNIAELYNRAGKESIDDGFIKYLEGLGPSAAAEVAEVANMSEVELKRYSELMENSATVTTDTMKNVLGEGFDEIVDVVASFVDNSAQTMKEQVEASGFDEIGKSVPEGMAKGIKDGTPDAVQSGVDMAEETKDATKDALGTNSPSKEFTTIGESVPEGMTLGINNGTPEAIAAAKKLATELLKPFDKTPAEFQKIGDDVMAGFNRGLVAGEAQVMATVNRIANSVAQTMRKALDTHSPSRVTMAIGEDTGEGLAIGIENKTKRNVQAVEGVADAVKKATERASKELADAKADAHNKEQEIEKKRNEDVRKKEVQLQNTKKKDYKKHNEEIRRINEQANKRLQEQRKKNASDLAKLEERHIKERLDAIKMYIQEKKSLNELSLIDEVYIWKEQIALFKEGTKERIEAQSAYKKAIEDVNKQVLDINEKYGKKMQDVNKKLADEEERIWDDFVQKREQRFKDIAGFASLFDEFEIDPQDNGEELLENLQGQVDGLEKWMDTIEKVSGRLSNADLIAELQGLGPKALGELMALNQLTDEQLSEYEELYWKKFALARVQAGEETKGMREDVFENIDGMKETAKLELEKLRDEWVSSIKDLTQKTDNELKSLEQIGADAGKGLDQGLASMKPQIIATATNIAEAIKNAMASALGIYSPSRVMRDEVGKWIPAGVAVGIKDNAKMVYDELERMADKMIVPASPEVALGTSRMALNGGLSDVAKNISTSTDNRRSYNPTFHNYFTKEESSPSEVSRKNKQQSQKQALEWGFA